jgi:hypothetical protein
MDLNQLIKIIKILIKEKKRKRKPLRERIPEKTKNFLELIFFCLIY